MSIRVSLAAGFVVLLTVAGGPRAFGECVTEESDKLTASDASTFDRFGMSVSVSGNTAVVGASMDDDKRPQFRIRIRVSVRSRRGLGRGRQAAGF